MLRDSDLTSVVVGGGGGGGGGGSRKQGNTKWEVVKIMIPFLVP